MLQSKPARSIDRMVRRLAASLRPGRTTNGQLPLGELLDTIASRAAGTQRMRAAADLRERFRLADDDGKCAFFDLLTSFSNVDTAKLDAAIARYQRDRDPHSLARLHAASEPGRQEVLRRLQLLPNGLAELIAMREHGLRLKGRLADFASLDRGFLDLLEAWFSPPFLELRRLDFHASAELLARLIEYEAVHAIDSWQSLRARLAPVDRRCYALFHPQLGDDPLIFIEIALTTDIPRSIDEILSPDREIIEPDAARVAVFYSISNCQQGLRGLPFGELLIKRAVEALRAECPSLDSFVTLSPIPGFAKWLDRQGATAASGDAARDAAEQRILTAQAARYLIATTRQSGDPVARFHLGNGAVIERLNAAADRSEKGMRQSHGMMVNYRYDLDALDRHRRAFGAGEMAPASSEVRRLAKIAPQQPSGLAPDAPA